MIDGAIVFNVSDGQGGTLALVPTVNDVNNDLILVSGQNSIEITNVHPGEEIYSTLQLECSWVSSDRNSLVSIEVACSPRVIGINGYYTWPNNDSVCHQNIAGNVYIYIGNSGNSAKAILTDKAGDSIQIPAIEDVITLTQEILSNATQNRLKITLNIDNENVSSIIFLPESESESFSNVGAIYAEDGTVNVNVEAAVNTDFIDVSDVTDIAYTGELRDYVYARLVAYDENKQFYATLIQAGTDTRHIVPSGNYRYVRACGNSSSNPSLMIYFRNRG